jgi:hypothetical protein
MTMMYDNNNSIKFLFVYMLTTKGQLQSEDE